MLHLVVPARSLKSQSGVLHSSEYLSVPKPVGSVGSVGQSISLERRHVQIERRVSTATAIMESSMVRAGKYAIRAISTELSMYKIETGCDLRP